MKPLLLLLSILSTPLYAATEPINSPQTQKPLSRDHAARQRIAIIGAGSAGASTAYYLSQYAAAANIPQPNVIIYERNDYIGGRSTTVNAFDDPSQPVELGASIFVEVNRNLYDAARAFNLTTAGMSSAVRGNGKQVLGIWNGAEFVLTQTMSGGATWEGIWEKAKLLFRYGLAPLRIINLMKETVGMFLTMYDAPIFPFRDLTNAVQSAGLLNATGSTGTQFLESHGLNGLFAAEVVQASTRVNYAQDLAYIHGLESMVCMATDGAMSIQGGNWRIFAGMVNASHANLLLNSPATEISKLRNGSYTVTHENVHSGKSTTEAAYDKLVIATPFQYSGLDFDPPHFPDIIPYVDLHVTLFTSPRPISPGAFKLDADADVPDVILTTLQPDEEPTNDPARIGGRAKFFSLSTLRKVWNPSSNPPRQEYLYKIFSPERADMRDLRAILGVNDPGAPDEITWLRRHVWQSYPYLAPRVTFENIKLDRNVYYTSGIESFISTMETSSLMGANVARLIVDEIVRKAGTSNDTASDGQKAAEDDLEGTAEAMQGTAEDVLNVKANEL